MMNERIKQLVEQSYEQQPLMIVNHRAYYHRVFNQEKFAELIVQECVNQCADNGSNDEWDKGVRWAAGQIIEHFQSK